MQPQFDLMCSDLSQLKVARAVAASSAVPGLFTAITLRNYAGSCGFERPEWLDEALASRRTSPRRFRDAEIAVGYLDSKKRKYIHLVDGGISDNIGLRRPLSNVIVEGGVWRRLKHVGIRRPGHIVVIVVNAANNPDRHVDLLATAPSLKAVLGSVSGVQIRRYNFETLELMRESLKRWARDAPPDEAGRKLQTHMVEVAFDLLENPNERHFFNNVKTSFDLDDETVDRLIEVGGRLLRESPDFQQLLGALQVSNHGGNSY
jgi:NTE family protein